MNMMRPSVSRRGFLQSIGTGAAATMWIPRQVAGYTSAEMKAKSDAGTLGVGVSKWELDTPALCVDVDKLERNIATMKKTLTANGITSRPHAKTHKTPIIAKMQIAGGSIGICTAKVSEAEAMFEGGLDRVLMTTCNLAPHKIRRAMAIAKANKHFIQAVDNPENARDLNDAAKEMGIVAEVVVDVAVGTRSGVPPGEMALELAQLVDKLPNLRLRGMISYDGGAQHIKGFHRRAEDAINRYVPSLETYEAMKKSGLNTEIFSGGGSGTYNVMHKIPGFTDVQAGSYIFMDAQYLEIGGQENEKIFTDFTPSLTVMTTVLNTYFPKRLTTDAGAKALTLNKPDAVVIGEEGFSYNAGSDEFGAIRYETATKTYRPLDKLELIVPHCDPAVNEYDQIYATRNDRVVAIWPVAARGHSQ
jgi:3-hydroxy-D-aspartate aldolase